MDGRGRCRPLPTVSGRTLECDGYQLVIDAATKGKFDVLVVWRRDRFGRDVVHNSVVERALQKAGVRIEAIKVGGPNARRGELGLEREESVATAG